jgi:zinc-binding alcohol dehydrogenase family protein
MRAIGYRNAGAITAADALIEEKLPSPVPGPRDLRVAVKAVSVNPADVKLRAGVQPLEGELRVLGFDAVGVVDAVGAEVALFKPGDEVFYAGAIDRPGSNSELHLVDERLVGRKPVTLSFTQAAALPLTSITAWELLFERLRVPYGVKHQEGTLLIINGAGGVGSILTQIARRLTGLTIVATASRAETIAWCKEMGAHHVINHHEPFESQLQTLGIGGVEYIAGLTATGKHLTDITRVIAPQGSLALIDDPDVLDITGLKRKSVSVHWELMFTRSLYKTPDMISQHRLLNEVADLVDAGLLRSTLTNTLGELSVATLRQAHALVESGKAIGKTVLEGFSQ